VKVAKKIPPKSEQSGIALLLAIFVLLLVCVVGLAMLTASGTETSLSGNYRSSTAVYYASLSGLEEGRGRLLPKNPNYLSGYIPPYGSTLALGHVIYITNPLSGETVDPTNLGNPATYPDTEYGTEFPFVTPSPVDIVPSATNLSGSPNPLYKWVRINALTEYALRIDVDNSGGLDQTQLIYSDGTNLTRSVAPYQALGVTALAALPDGSRKLLQYVAAPITLQLPIAAALMLEGPGTVANTITFNLPASYSFQVNGNDRAPGSNGGLSCGTTMPPVPAVGVLADSDHDYLQNTDLAPHPGNYTGAGSPPSVSPSPYPHPRHSKDPVYDMTDPTSLSNLVDLIRSSADANLTGPATSSDMPSAMSFSNPMTVVVNGDLTLTGYTGYGLLVVTGKLTYARDSGWKGIILVIGQGIVEETNSGSAPLDAEIDGAVFVANTVGSGGSLGPASYTIAGPGGKGIYYDTCWIAKAQKPIKYEALSFHEIPYP
jgi:hypothetical protein